MASNISSRHALLVCGLLAALALVASSAECRQAAGSARRAPERDQEEPLDLFPSPTKDCLADERPAPGKLPECEPTCANPRPVCLKVMILDFVPCFCERPKVRDTSSGRCVLRRDCP